MTGCEQVQDGKVELLVEFINVEGSEGTEMERERIPQIYGSNTKSPVSYSSWVRGKDSKRVSEEKGRHAGV